MPDQAPHARSLRALVNALDQLASHPGDDAAQAAAVRAARRIEPSLERVQLQLPAACPALLVATRVLEAEPLQRLLERLTAHGLDEAAAAPAWEDLPGAQRQRITALAARRRPRGSSLPAAVARILAHPGADGAAGASAWDARPSPSARATATTTRAAAAGKGYSPPSWRASAQRSGSQGAAPHESAEETLQRVLQKLRDVESKRQQATEEREEHLRAVHERHTQRRLSSGYGTSPAGSNRGDVLGRSLEPRGLGSSTGYRRSPLGAQHGPEQGGDEHGEGAGEDDGSALDGRPGSLISPEAIRAHVRARMRARREALEREEQGHWEGTPSPGRRNGSAASIPQRGAADLRRSRGGGGGGGDEDEDDGVRRGLQTLQVVHDTRMALLAQLERHREQARQCEEELRALEEAGRDDPAVAASQPGPKPWSKGAHGPVVRELTLGDLLMTAPTPAPALAPAPAPTGQRKAAGDGPKAVGTADTAHGAGSTAVPAASTGNGGAGEGHDAVPDGPLDSAFFDLSPFEAALK